MSRFIDDGTGITIVKPFSITVTLENKIAKLVRALEPENGVEYLTGALASVCTDEQLAAFAMNLEDRLVAQCGKCGNQVERNAIVCESCGKVNLTGWEVIKGGRK